MNQDQMQVNVTNLSFQFKFMFPANHENNITFSLYAM